ncbi:type II toxin-antitoxin system HicB family antitoxin [Companilactobacillus furfuricola]|uniref:type II toxin-antitoxin system HicB family antitoxin n=1 Tax=Companilactobacillus furfuricola TaxID=1462575 RepID=UPI000F7759A0|nr:type II toxin-antitoxin system HicB family antitoxin [Companilactobacillus furfuricola]
MTEHADFLVYPVIVSKFTDDGEYFVVTSPNIPGMVTQGDSFVEAVYWAQDAIATMLEGRDYPEAVDPTSWVLDDNQNLAFVSIDMNTWLANKA